MTKLRLFILSLTSFIAVVSYGQGTPLSTSDSVKPQFTHSLIVGFENAYYKALYPESMKGPSRPTLEQIFSKKKRIKIKNPEYNNKEIEYFGIDMEEFFEKIFQIDLNDKSSPVPFSRPVKHDEFLVIFRCADGYMPIMPLNWFKDGRAFLATRDKNDDLTMPRSIDNKWTMVTDKIHGYLKNPGPYYLVWDHDKYYNDGNNGWPYQIRGIFVTRIKNLHQTFHEMKVYGSLNQFNFGLEESYLRSLFNGAEQSVQDSHKK